VDDDDDDDDDESKKSSSSQQNTLRHFKMVSVCLFCRYERTVAAADGHHQPASAGAATMQRGRIQGCAVAAR